jgi:hypothetical protein
LVLTNPSLNLPRFGDGGVWYFNPLAWQFLFFLGLVVGNPARQQRSFAPRWLLVTLSVAMLAAGLVVLKGFEFLMQSNLQTFEDLRPLIEFYRTWAVKTELGPLRLLHFFALAYLTALVFPRTLAVWSQRWARPLIVAGQHSLEVYAFGLVLSFLGAFVLLRGPLTSAWGVVLVDSAACAASLAFGYFVAWWKTGSRQKQGGTPQEVARRHRGRSDGHHQNRPALANEKRATRRRKSGKPRSGTP